MKIFEEDLSAFGYGFFVYSPCLFIDLMKEKQCKARKSYINFLDKNKNIFFELVSKGIALPFYRVSCADRKVFISINTKVCIPHGWTQVYKYQDFIVQVGEDNKLAFSSFDYFHTHKMEMDNKNFDYSQMIPSGPKEVLLKSVESFSINIAKGTYHFDLIGLKNNSVKHEYGYFFVLSSYEVTENNNLEKCDNDKNDFEISHYDK